ncbi:hypothetical protein ACHAWF_018424 [Thalassiosira exigua]
MATDTMMSDASWPAVGNPAPPLNAISAEDPNPDWEMIAEEENENSSTPGIVDDRVLIFPTTKCTEAESREIPSKGRPRSATIGGEGTEVVVAGPKSFQRNSTVGKAGSSLSGSSGRTLRRCASTPDLVVCDSGHQVIVEDESDTDEEGRSGSNDSEDVELIEAEEEEEDDPLVVSGNADLEQSFEVLSDKNKDTGELKEEEEDEEPVLIDEERNSGGEEATLVSVPSVGTSSWTMASSAAPATTSVWGMKKSPSFKDILAKNLNSDASAPPGEWGKDKALTEARLRDSHRRHHIRVRTKAKFVVTDGADKGSGDGMKHAHSTGNLSGMLHAVEGGHESARSPRRPRRQLSAMMEEDEEAADFVIGRGNGGGGGGGGGGEVLGETDAMDFYRRKEHGSRSAVNKKKERPDEAKRREITMHKKDMQRKKQLEAQRGKGGGSNNGNVSAGGKKKKNDKGSGGKKERRSHC